MRQIKRINERKTDEVNEKDGKRMNERKEEIDVNINRQREGHTDTDK
jgi:hypothetical protein